jgi:hypothetical protein
MDLTSCIGKSKSRVRTMEAIKTVSTSTTSTWSKKYKSHQVGNITVLIIRAQFILKYKIGHSFKLLVWLSKTQFIGRLLSPGMMCRVVCNRNWPTFRRFLQPPSSGRWEADEGSKHLWNGDQFLPDYSWQHTRRESIIFILAAVNIWNLTKFVGLVCDIFNDAVCSSDYVVSNDRMINE